MLLFPVNSVEATNFTEALAQNVASAMNNLPGLPAFGARRYLIRALKVIAKDNFGPELNFFSSATAFTTDPATDAFVSRFGFTSGMGEQIGAAGLWRYYVDGLAIPYFDVDTLNSQSPPTVHVILQNISATAKQASPAGNVYATIWLEPQGGDWY